jgi:hypothetical protein
VRSSHTAPSTVVVREVPPGALVAMRLLVAVAEDAHLRRRSPWHAAVEIAELHRRHLADGDLADLVARGILKHAVEVTPATALERRFAEGPARGFARRSCFVLTHAGLASGAALVARAAAATVPRWDPNAGTLHWGEQLLKHFARQAVNQRQFLDAFEKANWVHRIDDPLPVRCKVERAVRLLQTAKDLNQGLPLGWLRFDVVNRGSGIRWSRPRMEAEIERRLT